jgi:hypothetical protein
MTHNTTPLAFTALLGQLELSQQTMDHGFLDIWIQYLRGLGDTLRLAFK